jgi:hypothetical protein
LVAGGASSIMIGWRCGVPTPLCNTMLNIHAKD